MTSPTPSRRRPAALLTALATALLLPACHLGASGSPHATSTPSQPPAPSLDDLSNATLEVPEICALSKSTDEAVRGATGTVTLTDGRATPQPGSKAIDAAVTSLKDVTAGAIDGRPVAVATITCAYGTPYADDVIVVYDSDLSLVTAIEPRTLRTDVQGHIDDITIDAVSTDSDDGDLVLSISQIGVYGDEPFHAAVHSGSASATYTWAGEAQGYAVSDVLYTIGDKKVRMPEKDDVQAFVDAVTAHDDDRAAQWATRDFMSALDRHAPLTTTSVRDSYIPRGSAVGECVLLPSVSKPDGHGISHVSLKNGGQTWLRPGAEPQVVKGAYYQAGDVLCTVDGPSGPSGPSGSSWLMLRGKEDGGVEVYTAGPEGD